MIDENKVLFTDFRKLHDEYALNPNRLQDAFNHQGEAVLELVREYENRLCANTERGQFIRYSGGLAEKFQAELRKVFPMIDYIGLKVEKFSIKKIKLL